MVVGYYILGVLMKMQKHLLLNIMTVKILHQHLNLRYFLINFSSITGAGPVTGPIIAAMYGWLPAFLWIIVGGIFFGAVQDFTALYASVKMKVNPWGC